jgi:iron complex outermembrane receptor protein
LKSYYTKASFIDSKTAVHLTHFSGKEKTYQSWYGTPEARALDDIEGIQNFIDRNFLDDYEADRLRNSDRRYNFYEYENQIDDYKQDHYSLHITHQIKETFQVSAALHLTKGNGFYEEFRKDDQLSNYNLQDQVIDSQLITASDLVRRRWLDNIFYGGILNVKYEIAENTEWIMGSGYHMYSGEHFGEIINIKEFDLENIPYEYYKSDSEKKDFNIYSKISASFGEGWNGYLDLQFRKVNYETFGKDNDLKDFNLARSFSFFNPKIGIQYSFDSHHSSFAYLGLGHREPDRNDFIDQFPDSEPQAERLLNIELGYNYQNSHINTSLGFYWMHYKNQLVLSGDLNDVGAPLRLNVPDSYRAGIEWELYLKLNKNIAFSSSLNLSINKIKLFKEVLYDYGMAEPGIIINEYKNSSIAFSPNIVTSIGADFTLMDPLKISLISKYVGKQYLDNTSNDNRLIDSYFIGDFILSYNPSFLKSVKNLSFTLQINNIWNALYSANGYTYSYIYGDLITENFLYPQAERNFMLGMKIKL